MGALEVLKGCNFVKAENVTDGDHYAQFLLKMTQQFQTSSRLPEALQCIKTAMQQPLSSKLRPTVVNTAGFVLTSLVKSNQVDKAAEIWQDLLRTSGQSGLSPTELFCNCCSHLVTALCKKGQNVKAVSLVNQSITAGWYPLPDTSSYRKLVTLASGLAPLEISLLLHHVVNNVLQGSTRELEILCSTCKWQLISSLYPHFFSLSSSFFYVVHTFTLETAWLQLD